MKKHIIFFLPFFLILVLSSCKKLERNNPLEGPLEIGDRLGDWGIVAYILQPGDIGYDATMPHGLIAAPSDQGSARWGCSGTAIAGADGTAIGTGAQNTVDIMNGCSQAGAAAHLCGDLVLGGYSDWYLPSTVELKKLYLNKLLIGGFDTSFYWSSTERYYIEAYFLWFYDGIEYSLNKNTICNVRAVRAF